MMARKLHNSSLCLKDFSGHFPGPPWARVITMATIPEELCSRRVAFVHVHLCIHAHMHAFLSSGQEESALMIVYTITSRDKYMFTHK